MRLWIPTLAFGVISYVNFLVFPAWHMMVGDMVHSGWFQKCWLFDGSLYSLVQEISVRPLFSGYRNSPITALFPGLKVHLADSASALNSPVWTMSVELLGSFLVLLSVRLRSKFLVLWLAFLACTIAWLPCAFGAFQLGHLAATLRLGDRTYSSPLARRLVAWLSLGCIVGGIIVAYPYSDYGFAQLTGCRLFFLGILSSPQIHKLLSARIFVGLGALSFTLYLLHWSIIYGPGAWLVFNLINLIGYEPGRIIGGLATLILIIVLSVKLAWIDRFAISYSHNVNRREFLSFQQVVALTCHRKA